MNGSIRRVAAAMAAVAGLVLVLSLSNVGALHAPTPHRLPTGVTGPPAASARLVSALAARAPGAFAIRSYPSEQAARQAVLGRDVYGAVILGGATPHLIVAGAASAEVASLMEQAFMRALPGLSVTDVRPLPSSDSRGLTAFSIVVSLLIGSVIVTVVAYLLGGGLRAVERIGLLVAFAVLCGLLSVLVAYVIVGALHTGWLAVAGWCALMSLAVTLPITAAQSLFGLAGTAIGALAFLVVGNAASGGASAPELLPGFWRTVSQILPPGATISGVRNTVYFDANRIAGPLVVLLAYIMVGLIVIVLVQQGRRHP